MHGLILHTSVIALQILLQEARYLAEELFAPIHCWCGGTLCWREVNICYIYLPQHNMKFTEKGSLVMNFAAFTLNKTVESGNFLSICVFLPFTSTEGWVEEGNAAFVLLVCMWLLYYLVLDKPCTSTRSCEQRAVPAVPVTVRVSTERVQKNSGYILQYKDFLGWESNFSMLLYFWWLYICNTKYMLYILCNL